MKSIITAVQRIKNLLNKTINNQKGVVLPIILMAIGGLSLLGAAAVSVSTGEMNIAHNDRNYKTAFNLAESGIYDAADGISGNRDLLPRPLGAITSTTYSFSVGGSAFSNTGRYNVVVTLPVVSVITQNIPLNASSVVVSSTAGLRVGDSVIIGNESSRYMTSIGDIDTTNNVVTLKDGQGNLYAFKEPFTANNVWISRNILRITSTGEAGQGLAGTNPTPSTIAGWRVVSTINAASNPAIPAAAVGAIRSTVTLQGEYTLQEVAVFDSAKFTVDNPGNRFTGPLLVTTKLTVQQYRRGDYSGPIFNATSPTNDAAISFTAPGGGAVPAGDMPKIIKVPGANNKVNLTTVFNQAAASATCYQTDCSDPKSSQQIYYLNGYQLDVAATQADLGPSAGFPMYIDSDSIYLSGGKIYFSLVIPAPGFTTSNSMDDVNINIDPTGGNPSPSNNQTPTLVNVVPANPGVHINGSGQGIQFDANTVYAGGTIITISYPAPATGTGYLRIWDNNNNLGIPGSNKGWSNGVFVTPLGNIVSEEYQGDTNVYPDAASGSHSTGGVNHRTILTTQPTRYAKGTYTPNGTSISGPTYTPVTLGNNDGGALLFGGKLRNTGTWTPGEQSEYYTTYYIHTDNSSCQDHDIRIVAKTVVTYLGLGQKCSTSGNNYRFFLYETVWTHTNITRNSGYQQDSSILPQTGYYKFVRTSDTTGDDKPFKPILAIGDKEFNSVFNHAAKTAFKSSVVNVNIGVGDDKGSINLVGYSNPPTKKIGSTMLPYSQLFTPVTWTTLPANPFKWDAPDISGYFSGFATASTTTGFDISSPGFSLAAGNIVPYTMSGNEVLPDVSTIPGTSMTICRNATPGVYPGAWGSYQSITVPTGTNGAPIMDPNTLPTSVITATISGPKFTWITLQRGTAPLLFNPANGIAFNVMGIKIETKSGGANITIGTQVNPATVYAQTISLEPEGCSTTGMNFNFVGKMVARNIELENNVKYNMNTTLGGASCLSTATQSFIYLRKNSWTEIRN